MRKLLVILCTLLTMSIGISAYAQNTTVTATVIDSDGTMWINGSWSITFTPNPSQPNIGMYNINGTPLSASVLNQKGSIDGSGDLSVTVYQNGAITPVGSTWTITVCPNAVTKCGIYNFTTASLSSLSITSPLTSIIPAPRFAPVSGTYGYNDAEAILQLRQGSTYWNVTTQLQECYGTSWGTCGGASGSFLPIAGGVGTGAFQISNAGVYNVKAPPDGTAPAAGDGSTDDTAVLQHAVAYSELHNICLEFPPGHYLMTTGVLVWDSGNINCMHGTVAATGPPGSMPPAYIDYEGSSSVQAAFTVDNSDPTTLYYSQIDWRDIGFEANTHAQYAVYTNNIGGKSPTSRVTFAGGSVSAFGGFGFNPQASAYDWTVVGNIIPCVNGVTFGQSASHYSFPSSQITLYDPTIEYCTGVGLNITNGNGIQIVGAQIAANHQNFAINCGQCTLVGGLYEKAGITAANDTVTGYNNTFNIDDSNVFEVASGASQTSITGGYYGNKLQIDVGAVGTKLGAIRLTNQGSTYFSDGGTGTVYNGPFVYAVANNSVASNIPQTQQTSQSAIAGLFGTYDPSVTVTGTWYITVSNAVQPLINQVFVVGKAWVATLNGQFGCGACTNPQIINMPLVIYDTSNVVTLNNGETITFQVDPTTGHFEFTSAASDIQYTGTITFIPFSNTVAGKGPVLPTSNFTTTLNTGSANNWYQIALDYPYFGSDSPVIGNVILTANAVGTAYFQQVNISVSVDPYDGICSVSSTSVGQSLIINTRCSFSGTAPLGQLEVETGSLTDSIFISGQYTGLMTPTILGVQTVASTALSGGNNVYPVPYVGAVIQQQVPFSSAVSIPNNTCTVIASISLTPGDWDVTASGNFFGSSVTTLSDR